MAQELGSFVGVWRTRGGQTAVIHAQSDAYLYGNIEDINRIWRKDGRYDMEIQDHTWDLMERLDGKVK